MPDTLEVQPDIDQLGPSIPGIARPSWWTVVKLGLLPFALWGIYHLPDFLFKATTPATPLWSGLAAVAFGLAILLAGRPAEGLAAGVGMLVGIVVGLPVTDP